MIHPHAMPGFWQWTETAAAPPTENKGESLLTPLGPLCLAFLLLL